MVKSLSNNLNESGPNKTSFSLLSSISGEQSQTNLPSQSPPSHLYQVSSKEEKKHLFTGIREESYQNRKVEDPILVSPMNDPEPKQKEEPSAMSIIADAAAKAAQVVNNSPSISFHSSLQSIPTPLNTHNIFERNNAISSHIDSVSHNISGGGIPLKKRKASGSVVVNASDMDVPSKQSIPLSSSIERSFNIAYSQPPKSLVTNVTAPSSLDILASSTNSVVSSSILDQLPNNKSTYLTNTSIATPATPIGQVVESGQEQTGRWTREEHEAFLSALQKYGKEWKKVAAKVKTRTVVQTRTHAQKYFQKLQKAMAGGNDMSNSAVDAMMMMAKDEENNGSDGVKKKITTPLKTPQRRLPSLSKLMREQEQAEATAAAAQLMAQMSSPALIHTKKSPSSSFPLNQGAQDSNSSTPFFTYSNTHPVMKITAPTHEQVNDRIKQYGYPEPSPAACGKRKLAEIAAAQMLAGVAASGNKNSNAMKSNSPPNMHFKNVQTHSTSNSTKNVENASSLQIVNPDNLTEDGLGGKKKPKWMMGNSPTTPWEDQLEALVSQFRNKEKRSLSDSSSSTQSSMSSNMVDVLPPLQPQPSHSALHTAVISSDVDQVSQLLKLILSSSSSSLKPNLLGYTPLHSATCLKRNSLEITKLILSVGAEVMESDKDGNTALHWAVRGGNSDVVHTLIIRNCLLDAPNNLGETPLHWAMRAGPAGMIVARTLLANGAKPHTFSKPFLRPLDVAALGFSTGSETRNLEETRETRKNFFLHSPQSRSLILHHPECLEHTPKNENDWEVPDRINSILKSLDDEECKLIYEREITISSEFERASLELLSRVHSAEYLAFVNDLSKELERRKNESMDNKEGDNKASVVPFTPLVQRTMMKNDGVEIGTHSDTSFSVGSLKAARRAAGAVQHSVDCVLMGRNPNAFCIIRPPGHHAGYNGLLNDSESSGFCIFNNIAAGAMHALSERHRTRCERVAILDIDVHHGNGTEDIVRKINDPARILFFSVHLFDQELSPKKAKKGGNNSDETSKNGSAAWKFYPGTGEGDDVAHNVINVPIAPLWREKDFIDCVSSSYVQSDSNLQNPYNTRNKQRQKGVPLPKATKAIEINEENIQESSSKSQSNGEVASGDVTLCSKVDTEENQKSIESVESDKMLTQFATISTPTSPRTPTPSQYLLGTGRRAYRRAIQHRLIPALRAFNPDLILISAGFDAAKEDVGNAKHMASGKAKMGIDLEPEDYAWTTRKIMEVADICCQGRVVSVLEGGYGRTPSSSDETLLDKSIFSQCALMHLNALVDPYNTELRHSGSSEQTRQRQNSLDGPM